MEGRHLTMRSISPVIATVILLLMTVAAGGLAYITITGFQSQAQSGGEGAIQQLAAQTQSQLKIESASGGKIYVRNTGTQSISKIITYIDGVPRNITCPEGMEPSRVYVCELNEPIPDCPTGVYVQVEVGSGGASETLRVRCEELEPSVQYQLTTFSDGSSNKTITFQSEGSQIANITLPLTASVSSAILNLAGLRTWSSITNISQDAESSYFPQLTSDPSGNLHVVWYSSPGDILYKNRTSFGWSQALSISYFSLTEGSYFSSIASDPSGNLHLVWPDEVPYPPEISYKNRTSSGWSEIYNVSQTTGDSWTPKIAIDTSGNLHVVWSEVATSETKILYKNLTSSGWSEIYNVSQDSGSSDNPHLAIDSLGNLHVVWQDYISNYEISYKNRTSSGWSEIYNVSQNTETSNSPRLAFDTLGNLHVVWSDHTPGNWEIFYKNRTSSGWSEVYNISQDSEYSIYPQLAFDTSGNLHVVWRDYTNNKIFYKNRTSSGWSEVLEISSVTFVSAYPQLTSDSSGNIHIVWSDTTPNPTDIFYETISTAHFPSMRTGSAGSTDWSYSPYFNTTSSANFAPKLSTILSSNCTCPSCYKNSTHCTIGLNFTTQSAGIIQLSNLNVVYT